MTGASYLYIKKLSVSLFIALVFLSLSRVVFYLNNLGFFNQSSVTDILIALLHGIRFDISIVLTFNALFITLWLLPNKLRLNAIYQKVLLWLFVIVNGILVLFNLIDAEYFKFTKKRSTVDFLDLLFISDDATTLTPTLLVDYWYLTLVLVAMVMLMYWAYRKYVFLKTPSEFVESFSLKYLGVHSVILLLFIGVSFIGIRGGFQGRPINIVTASEFSTPPNNILVLNTPFTILQTLGKNDLSTVNYLPDNELKKYFRPLKLPKNQGSFQEKNVVIIIVESLSKELVGSINGLDMGFTPFIDSIISVGYVCDNAYSNGAKSIEGIPAILASIPSYMDNPFITSSYILNNFNSIASLLKKKGYTSAFFHGGTNGTMGFDTFCGAAQFDKYYGRNEYNNDAHYDGNWGIWDEEFLQYSCKVITEMKKPCIASVFTLTSHHPYHIPDRYKNTFATEEQELYRALMYTDYSLKRFFESAAKTDWYSNTLFVITADHPWQSQTEFYKTFPAILSIPIVFYAPGENLKGVQQQPTQQADIMPSILSYLNYDLPYVAFGENVFDKGNNNFACSFVGGNYQFTKGDYTLQFNGNEVFGLYNYKTDSLKVDNLKDVKVELRDSLELELKAYIQQYNNRLIANRMLN